MSGAFKLAANGWRYETLRILKHKLINLLYS